MDEKEYSNKLFEIAKELKLKLFNLQNQLNQKELTEYEHVFRFFIYDLIEGAVGNELVVHYIITILDLASKKQYQENNMKTMSIDRFERIREEQLSNNKNEK